MGQFGAARDRVSLDGFLGDRQGGLSEAFPGLFFDDGSLDPLEEVVASDPPHHLLAPGGDIKDGLLEGLGEGGVPDEEVDLTERAVGEGRVVGGADIGDSAVDNGCFGMNHWARKHDDAYVFGARGAEELVAARAVEGAEEI